MPTEQPLSEDGTGQPQPDPHQSEEVDSPATSEGLLWVVAIVAAIALGVSLLSLGTMASNVFEHRNWEETSGTVVINGPGARHPSLLAVEYLGFEPGESLTNAGCKNLAFGIFYEGTCRVNTAHPTYMGGPRDDLEVGDEVIVFYDPGDTTTSALERPASNWGRFATVAVIAALLLALLWHTVVRVNRLWK